MPKVIAEHHNNLLNNYLKTGK